MRSDTSINPVTHGLRPVFGRRQRNKIDKLLRIKAAARHLFVYRGYDDTTTREIALRAGVGMGTVFIYAANKRDLLFLIANEDLEQVTRRASASVSEKTSLIGNLLGIARCHYEYFRLQPDLSKLMLREMLFYDSGQQADRFKTTREDVIAMMAQAVQYAKDSRSIKTSESTQVVGWMLFCIYQVELRHWLATDPSSLEAGLRRLARMFRLAITGMAPAPASMQRRSQRAKLAPSSNKPRPRKK